MSTNMSPFIDSETNASKSRMTDNSKKANCLIATVVILAFVLVAFLVAIILLALVAGKKHDLCTTPGCLAVAMDLLNAIDTKADPCEDFYQFACGKWSASYSGPGTSKMGATEIKALFDLHEKVYNAVLDPDVPDVIKSISVAYIQCSSYGDLREQDELWLKEKLEGVGGWPMADRDWNEKNYLWERNLAQAIHTLGISSPLDVDVDVNPLDTKRRMLMIGPNSLGPFPKEKILYIAKRLGGRDERELEREFKEIDDFAQQLYKIIAAEDMEDNQSEMKVMTISEMNRVIHWMNWLEFFRAIVGAYVKGVIYETEPVVVGGVTAVSNTVKLMFDKVNKRTLANYIAAVFIQKLTTINTGVGAGSEFISLKTQKELSKKTSQLIEPKDFSATCLNFLSAKASLAVDFINNKNRKAAMVDQKMLSYFSSAMKDMIEKAGWLDDKTRTEALDKLKSIRYFIGFPAKAKDPKTVNEYFAGLTNITFNALRNQLIIERHFFKRKVELLREEVDFSKWPSGEKTQGSQLNAIYFGQVNGVVIPADMQLDPIFNAERPAFWNFGGFGWIIGHEITHAFDTAGSKRDQSGNLRDWWMPKAKTEFEKRSKCLIDQYNKIPYGYKNYHVNGTQTIGENVADNGGLRQAYAAYKKWEKDNGKEKRLPGLEKYNTDQLFFLSSIQIYCSLPSDPEELYNSHVEDEHSPVPMRFSPAASNFDAFGETFKCKRGSPMNPVKKCVVW